LAPVVQTIDVAVTEDTTHVTPSIITYAFAVTVPKFVPVMVKDVPPNWYPNLGYISETVGVKEF